SSGSESYGRDSRHWRRRKCRGRSRSKGNRRHHRPSRDTETSSDSDGDDDSESEGSRDRRRKKRTKGHKSSKRSSRKLEHVGEDQEGWIEDEEEKRSDSEDLGTPDHATANANRSNVAKEEEAIIRSRETTEARSQPAALGDETPAPPLVIRPMPLPRAEAAQNNYGGALRPGEGDAIAQFFRQGKRVPQHGEVGLSAEEIQPAVRGRRVRDEREQAREDQRGAAPEGEPGVCQRATGFCKIKMTNVGAL
ncbi:hypothetical protein BAE44_0005568, partial [Dichanthelium oligosanthes]